MPNLTNYRRCFQIIRTISTGSMLYNNTSAKTLPSSQGSVLTRRRLNHFQLRRMPQRCSCIDDCGKKSESSGSVAVKGLHKRKYVLTRRSYWECGHHGGALRDRCVYPLHGTRCPLHFVALPLLCLLARAFGQVRGTAFSPGSWEPHLGSCPGVPDGDTCAGRLWVHARSAPGGANEESECGCSPDPGRSFQRQGCRKSRERAWSECRSTTPDS